MFVHEHLFCSVSLESDVGTIEKTGASEPGLYTVLMSMRDTE